MTTALPDDEEGSVAFEQVNDHGDDVDAIPDPHSFPIGDDDS